MEAPLVPPNTQRTPSVSSVRSGHTKRRSTHRCNFQTPSLRFHTTQNVSRTSLSLFSFSRKSEKLWLLFETEVIDKRCLHEFRLTTRTHQNCVKSLFLDFMIPSDFLALVALEQNASNSNFSTVKVCWEEFRLLAPDVQHLKPCTKCFQKDLEHWFVGCDNCVCRVGVCWRVGVGCAAGWCWLLSPTPPPSPPPLTRNAWWCVGWWGNTASSSSWRLETRTLFCSSPIFHLVRAKVPCSFWTWYRRWICSLCGKRPAKNELETCFLRLRRFVKT